MGLYPIERTANQILSLYCLTLGQTRQAELLEYICQNYDDTGETRDLFIYLSPFCKDSSK